MVQQLRLYLLAEMFFLFSQENNSRGWGVGGGGGGGGGGIEYNVYTDLLRILNNILHDKHTSCAQQCKTEWRQQKDTQSKIHG